jgi:hypothetical protein
MTYKEQLFPWCIIRPFPNMRTQIVGRFRNRGDAEGHLRVLKRMIPGVSYQIMFDITPERTDSEDLTPPAQYCSVKEAGGAGGAGGEVNLGVKPS